MSGVVKLLTRSGVWRSAGGMAAAGVAGNLIVAGVRRLVPPGTVHRAAVSGVAGGIRLGRSMARTVEEAQLRAGDLVAEAHASMGEEAPVPGAAPDEHDHPH